MPSGLLCNLVRELGLHHAGGAFGDQRFEVDAIDQINGVDDVAFGFRHLLTLAVAHQAMYIDRVKRHLSAEVERHHDHAGHPEEDDVEASDEYRGWVELAHLRRLFWPAQR